MPLPEPVVPPAVLWAVLLLAFGLVVLLLVLLLRRDPARALATAQQAEAETLRQALATVQRSIEIGQRTEAEAVRSALAGAERALGARSEQARMEAQAQLAELTARLVREQGEQRVLMETKLREMSEQAALRLAAIQHSVNAQLAQSIEKEMQGSFQRVIDQFAAVQKAMGDVQAVTGQIGDLKRIFTNVKSRGFWGETQLRGVLEDMLPDGGWEANRKLRTDSEEVVEFVLVMPAKGHPRPVLAIDAKFPAEDYDRLLLANEAGNAEEERAARRALEARLRGEARKIASKYIVPPVTVDYAVMYLPTDSLYVEAARIPGLIDTLGREHRVFVIGPALLPALVRTIGIGAMSLTIAENAEKIGRTLGAVRGEFRKIDLVLARLERQTGTVGRSIAEARTRTRAMDKQLQTVAEVTGREAAELLLLEATEEEDAPAEE